ncbi:hypothetical protein CDAR_123961 [Caerostris darwini]|uniref:Ycf15 n=1 Tax=Caerostris darwini TaxID=1538125 RepID=A0AAV4W0A1_9ARAC|nr:hypothetical protein CDAR_123961 [Caerostris darwini]
MIRTRRHSVSEILRRHSGLETILPFEWQQLKGDPAGINSGGAIRHGSNCEIPLGRTITLPSMSGTFSLPSLNGLQTGYHGHRKEVIFSLSPLH